jgi:hypothetical protein
VPTVAFQQDQILVDREAPHLRRRPSPFLHGVAVFPEQLAGARVERLNDVARVGHEHHAVPHDRRGL